MSAISFKTLTQDDITTSRTLLHEAIPITGTLISGTYATSSHSDGRVRENNIKTYSHGMFQSVYDYPYASSSANHLFDITWGYISHSAISSFIEGESVITATAAGESTAGVVVQKNKKLNIYNQFGQILRGYDVDNKIKLFDANNDDTSGIAKWGAVAIISFSRLLVKDEIKKGTFKIVLGTGAELSAPFTSTNEWSDADAATNYRSNSPAGEVGLLKTEGGDIRGLIYYQAGVVVMNLASAAFGGTFNVAADCKWVARDGGLKSRLNSCLTGSIDEFADGLRNRIQSINFNNTTELNSTIYFCRAHKGEFNYSANPTYLSGSKIRVKTDPGTNEFQNPPMSYVTTVGLYSPDNVLLAVAKLSEPVKKTPINELNLRVRLDY
tara:strand:- start:575 stop:1720 length:1146 start_codon:yes stop_codon:yes gene_type:complete